MKCLFLCKEKCGGDVFMPKNKTKLKQVFLYGRLKFLIVHKQKVKH